MSDREEARQKSQTNLTLFRESETCQFKELKTCGILRLSSNVKLFMYQT